MNLKKQKIKLSELHLNTGQIKDVPQNARFIKDERFEALKKSIQDDPEMLDLRELIVYDNGGELVIIMGNMRYRAMKELGIKDAPVKILPQETTAKKLRAYIQKDNIAFGQNDWDLLANEWDLGELMDFGLECDFLNNADTDETSESKEDESRYSRKIESPVYQITGAEPAITECVSIENVQRLLDEIDKSTVSDAQKEMLRICAYRHARINFENMAEYYAHQDKEMQELMENNALVIIDFDKAIERGFVDMTKKLLKLIPEHKPNDDTAWDESDNQDPMDYDEE